MTQREHVSWLLQVNNLTQTWLIANLTELGHDVSKTNMSDLLRGVRINAPILDASEKLLEDYSRWMKEYKKNYTN